MKQPRENILNKVLISTFIFDLLFLGQVILEELKIRSLFNLGRNYTPFYSVYHVALSSKSPKPCSTKPVVC